MMTSRGAAPLVLGRGEPFTCGAGSEEKVGNVPTRCDSPCGCSPIAIAASEGDRACAFTVNGSDRVADSGVADAVAPAGADTWLVGQISLSSSTLSNSANPAAAICALGGWARNTASHCCNRSFI